MILATDSEDFASGTLGMVELTLSFLNDRKKKQFAKAEIIEYLNQEQLKLASHINLFYETYFVTSATTDTVADQAVYAMPTDLVKFMGMEVADTVSDDDPQGLVEVHYSQRRFYQGLEKAQDKEGMRYFFLTGGEIDVRPVDGAGSKKIRIFYVKRLTAMAGNGDTSEIPAEHHELLCFGAGRRGRMKMGRPNAELNRMYAEALELMRQSIARLSPLRVEQVVPWHGSSGPVPPLWGDMR